MNGSGYSYSPVGGFGYLHTQYYEIKKALIPKIREKGFQVL